jgi:tetratricopeptide (TPR) repeat protein
MHVFCRSTHCRSKPFASPPQTSPSRLPALATQGRYTDAEPFNKRALAIYEKALGPDHPLVATSLNNLAGLYNNQGRYAEAEPLYKRALAIQEKALGPEHSSVATTMNNLAELYRNQGRYNDAEALRQSMLAIIDDTDHPQLANPKYWAPFVVVGEPQKPAK